MNEFIEKNKGLLKFYCVAARLLGWGLLAPGIIWGSIYYMRVISAFGNWEAMQAELNSRPSGIFRFILVGILAIGAAQFIRYMFGTDRKPGWILRYGHQVLYLCAGLLIVHHVWMYIQDPSFHPPNLYMELFLGLVMVLFTTVEVLVLVGLGQVLQRVLPVIEESKTLV